MSGLSLKLGDIDGLEKSISNLQNDAASIRGDMYDDVIINATFDPGSRNLKLFSRTRTVATVNIPAGGNSSKSTT
ncbi:hypothetical protein [Paenibacillus polymyxa]|uniref:hypothetical protein n=1 Tax=Paenibacillus polymyxa TaxID=1406 RepID=UPI001E443768|nr:hypothetical protein [Paenibacillus polymyxa]